MGGDGTLPGGKPMSSMDVRERTPSQHDAGAGNITIEVPL